MRVHQWNNLSFVSFWVFMETVMWYSYFRSYNYYGYYFYLSKLQSSEVLSTLCMAERQFSNYTALNTFFISMWDISWISDYYISFPWGKIFRIVGCIQVLYMPVRNGKGLLSELQFSILFNCAISPIIFKA